MRKMREYFFEAWKRWDGGKRKKLGFEEQGKEKGMVPGEGIWGK